MSSASSASAIAGENLTLVQLASAPAKGPADKGAKAASAGSVVPQDTLVEAKAACSFDCGTCLPISQLFRSNARAAPACHPCNNARKAILYAASKDPEQKAALASLQRNDPTLYKSKVRGCRLVDSGEQGVASVLDRRTAINNLLVTLSQTVGVEESNGLLWLKRAQWIAFHKLWEATPEEVAAADFDKRAASKNTEKMQLPGDEPRIAVMDIPKTKAFRKREFTNAVSSSVSVSTQKQATAALGQMAQVGVGPGSLNANMFGQFADHLRPGVAAGSASGQLLLLDSTAAPKRDMVIPDEAFEGPVPKRALSAQMSDPQDAGKTKKARRAGKAALSGVTGQLYEMRQRGLSASEAI